MNALSIQKFARDTRGGSEFIQMIILVVAVALFGLGAYQKFGSKVKKKVEDTAEQVTKIEGKD
jgi:hypothetical protein